MSIDYERLRDELINNKVYDAWPYVVSMQNAIKYMRISQELLKNIFKNYNTKIKTLTDNKIDNAIKNPCKPIPLSLEEINISINIEGYEIGIYDFLQKTTLDFFHFARLSIEMIYQVINKALFGDDSYQPTERDLVKKVDEKLNEIFPKIKEISSKIMDDTELEYVRDFDNYTKHNTFIYNIVKITLFKNEKSTFKIGGFTKNGKNGKIYPAYDLIEKTKIIMNTVLSIVEDSIKELMANIKDCTNNKNRFQELTLIHGHVKGIPESNSYDYKALFLFNEAKEASSLSRTISVFPIKIIDCSNIQTDTLNAPKIFISNNKEFPENGIFAVAEYLQDRQSDNLYKIYDVKKADVQDFNMYICNYKMYNFKINEFAVKNIYNL